MKIQIDTERKTVKVLEDTNLLQLIMALKRLLGDDYEEYTFITTTTYTYWSNPIVIPWRDPWPLTQPWITYNTNANGSNSIYNVNVQGIEESTEK